MTDDFNYYQRRVQISHGASRRQTAGIRREAETRRVPHPAMSGLWDNRISGRQILRIVRETHEQLLSTLPCDNQAAGRLVLSTVRGIADQNMKITTMSMKIQGTHTLTSPAEELREPARRHFLGRCATLLRGVTIVGIMAPLATGCDTSLEPGAPGQNGNDQGGNTQTFDVSTLTSDGQGVLTSTKGPDGYSIMIVRTGEGNYTALSTRCTHQGCDVNLPENGAIACPCHGSRFALDGSVLNGPANAPLTEYTLTYDEVAATVAVTIS